MLYLTVSLWCYSSSSSSLPSCKSIQFRESRAPMSLCSPRMNQQKAKQLGCFQKRVVLWVLTKKHGPKCLCTCAELPPPCHLCLMGLSGAAAMHLGRAAGVACLGLSPALFATLEKRGDKSSTSPFSWPASSVGPGGFRERTSFLALVIMFEPLSRRMSGSRRRVSVCLSLELSRQSSHS